MKENLETGESLAENKLIILYLLNNADCTLTNLQILRLLYDFERFNYYYFQHLLSDLVEKGYVMNYNIYNKNKGIYVVLGNFDGLHIGHMSLIDEAVKLSIENNCYCMLYSFKNHPLKLINKDIAPKLLMTNTNKAKTLQKKSVEYGKIYFPFLE